MDNITATEFRTRFAEFRDTTAYPDSVINMYIVDSANEVNFDLFEARGPKAQAYLSAHYLWLGRPFEEGYADGGTPVPGAGEAIRLLASESEGDSSQSFVTSDAVAKGGLDGWLALSSYGQVYLAMRDVSVPGVTNTGQIQFQIPRGGGRRGPFGWLR
jgi:hypothetical protein